MLAGLLVAAGFAPLGWWPLTVLGVALFTLVCFPTFHAPPRRLFGLGWLFGLALLTATISWVHVIAWPVAVLLILFEALAFGLLGVLVNRLARLPGWPVLVAAAWVLVEWIYSSVPFDGFGWSRLGYTAVDSPIAGWFPILGISGASLVVALLGQCVAAVALTLWRARGRRLSRRPIALVVAAGLVLLVPGQLLRGWQPADDGHGQVAVGIVQGNIDGVGIDAMGRARTVTHNHLGATIELMAKARTGQVAMPDLVLWPENSTDIDPTLDAATRRTVQNAADLVDRPIVVGAVTSGPGVDERQTTTVWWDPSEGPQARYAKHNLVPFGEYIPFRDTLLPLVPMLQLVGAQGVPGVGPGVVEGAVGGAPGGRLAVGVAICFELAYDDTMAEAVLGGAQIFVVQSNQATYAGTAEVPQQFAMTRARAMELRREMAVATTNAASGYIERDGTVSWRTRELTAATTTVEMPIRTALTPAVRIGPWLDVVCAALALAGLGLALLTGRPRRQR